MTAYEVTQDLLESTGQATRPVLSPARRTGRWRILLTAGLAGGALLLGAPAASAAQAAPTAPHSTVAESSIASTLPVTVSVTTRRTGSVIR